MRLIILILTIFHLVLFAELPDSGVTELKLSNGMRVLLKPNDNGEKIVSLQMTAMGGYTSFNPDKQAAARLSADIAWESGFSTLPCKDIVTHLYDYSIEFNYSVEPWYRFIVGSTPSENFPELLKLIECFFTAPSFDKTAIDEMKHAMATKLPRDNPEVFAQYYYEVNGLSQAYSTPITSADLNKITLQDAEASYKTLFQNPNDFVTVIVGDFNPEVMKTSLEQTIAKIPKGTSLNIPRVEITSPQKSRIFVDRDQFDARVGLSFPIPFPLTEDNFYLVYLICEGIEYALRDKLMEEYDSHFGLDVSFEVPAYPMLTHPWIFIEFHPPAKKWRQVEKLILSTLQDVQKNGFNEQIRKDAQKSIINSDEFWQREDDYWLSLISDAALFGWDVNAFFKSRKAVTILSLDEMNGFFKKLNFTNYTELVSLPE